MLVLQETDGTPIQPFNFGPVLPGSTTAAKLFKLTNTGDAPITAPKAWIEQGSTVDGALQVTIGNTAVTGTTSAAPTTLPAIAAGASLSGSAVWTLAVDAVGVPVDSGTLRIKLY